MRYEEFLISKELRFAGSGVEVADADLHPALFHYQRAIVPWALRKGRAAIFSGCGTGKTIMQCEWARHLNVPTLIFAPLCVADQTIEEARARLGLTIGVHGQSDERVQIVNYERLHQVEPSRWGAVVLDESSILKSVDGKTRSALIESFRDTPLKLCCTATPWPNDPAEIGNHSEFLRVMSRAEMLASFFINRGEGNRAWDLKGHAREAFFRWLASWACFLRRPSDLGYSDAGFDLPSLDVRSVVVPANVTTPGRLFPDRLRGVQDRAAARKATAEARVGRAAQILGETTGQAIAWCGLNDEQERLAALLGDCVSVTGSMPNAAKEAAVRSFVAGEVRILVTKLDIVGFGMNFQCATTQVFVGIGDSFEKYYQGIRRSWRFGQTRPVIVHIVVSDLEEEIVANVKRKEREGEMMQDEMVGRVAEFERAEMARRETVAPYSEDVARGEGWELWRGDSNEIMAKTAPGSVDLSVFSPPFAQLYAYSASERDLGNCRSVEEFLEGFAFFISGLRRVMKPGRIVACHCQQLPTQKARDGVVGMRDFRGMLISAFERGGFVYQGEVAVDKNPQAQAIRTRTKGLAFAQLEKDAAWMRPCFLDYVLVMRAPGENAVPVSPDCTREEWIEWAHGVWYHIRESDTLQVAEARDAEDEKHICALQLPTIRRCIRLWSNRGETVADFCAGIGSTGYEAIKNGRRFLGCELKESYWRTARKNLAAAEADASAGTLFGSQGP